MEADVGADGGGYADAGVVEEFLEDDDFHSLPQERGVVWSSAEAVEPDAAEPGPVEQSIEVRGRLRACGTFSTAAT
ncbi:hypothetical protein [Streptomyces anulatus]|uniref:hypothetical protein n=1 Tax=Streptomyces anulatus TaxID=1892 RepID=UPI0038633335